jgi:hypothetical protein
MSLTELNAAVTPLYASADISVLQATIRINCFNIERYYCGVMTVNSSFKQQASAWQRQFAQRQRGNIFQRILAWLVLGVMLVVAAALLLFMLLISWLVIPIVIYRYRQKMRRFAQAAQQAGYGQSAQQQAGQQAEQRGDSRVIEGEVIRKDER